MSRDRKWRIVRNRARFLGGMAVFWVLACYFFYFLRSYDSVVSRAEEIHSLSSLPAGMTLLLLTLTGALAGLFFGLVELWLDRESIQRLSYGSIMGLKLIIYLFISFVILFSAGVILLAMQGEMRWVTLIPILLSKTFIVVWIYTTVVAMVLTFGLQINRKFGPGILASLLLGKYHRPVEEHRIFLFIDMKGSTTIAEEIGHLQYSSLIQDCFKDLTPIIVEYSANIYQYVGDEVILFWPHDMGVRDNRCVEAYFAFQERLHKHGAYYEEEYGLRPFFKAGLHGGIVTVTEVGVIKKEIAFHGDVLNTASRIQSECNRFGEAFLASGSMIQALPFLPPSRVEHMGEMELRGKKQKLELFAIRPS